MFICVINKVCHDQCNNSGVSVLKRIVVKFNITKILIKEYHLLSSLAIYNTISVTNYLKLLLLKF